ncbi:MAG: hypothetical protein AB8B55_24555 [Mariniblastus sp.]
MLNLATILLFARTQDVAPPNLLTQKGKIWITNIVVQKNTIVKIWIKGADERSVPPLSGTLEKFSDATELGFKPRFPLGDKEYIVVVLHGKKEFYRGTLDLTKPTSSGTSVVKIFPTADTLPENTLKFYVQFSGPMQKGDIYKHIKIREVDGKEVELPFLEIEQEFWSRDSLRLTLLLDPGRIKRGLKPREEMGPIFEANKSYELVISKNWSDAEGRVLVDEFVKRFKIGNEDHEQPSLDKWKVEPPIAKNKSALRVQFTGPLDRAMLQSAIQVLDMNDKAVAGQITVSENETVWAFVPTEPWSVGKFKILVDDDLEDVAGNSIARPFDVDVFEKTESSKPLVLQLEFEVSQ